MRGSGGACQGGDLGERFFAEMFIRSAILWFCALVAGLAPSAPSQPAAAAFLGQVRGRVIDARGEPIADALVQTHAVKRATGVRYVGNDDITPSARTGPEGGFTILGRDPFLALTVTVEAPGQAKGVFPDLTPGGPPHELKLLDGAEVTGRLVRNGQPIVGAVVALSDPDQSPGIFALHLTAATDEMGRFRIRNVPPKRRCLLAAEMASLGPGAALSARPVTVGADRSTLDLGDLPIEPAFTVQGRLDLPAGTSAGGRQVVLGRNGPRDQQETQTDAGGRFQFSGVPGEIITVRVEIPGHRLTARNGSLAPAAPDHLVGRVAADKPDLLLQFEPGPRLAPLQINAEAQREEPLRGAERSAPAPNTHQVTATVADSANRVPVEKFDLTEGRYNAAAVFDWFSTRRESITNSAFTTHLPAARTPSALVIESENHLPWISGPIHSDTNLTILLQRGDRTEGVVLRTDGMPAGGVEVYLTDLVNGIYANGPPIQLADPANKNLRVATTDARGHFAFSPHPGAISVAVLDDAGFAHVKLTDLPKTKEIRLVPWARISGKLRVGSSPGAHEPIRLVSAPPPYQWFPREMPAFSLLLAARTDADGAFTFDRVPPIMLELSHSPEIADGAPGLVALTQSQRVVPKPGETLPITLGGEGRVVVGQFKITGYEGPVSWASSPQTMENILPHRGPSDAAMQSLLEKLRATAPASASPSAREEAEQNYQRERADFAAKTREYFATPEGLAALMASRRYYVQIAEDGSFRINDLPPGQYRLQLRVLNDDPALRGSRRATIANFATEITIPEGTRELDLGVIPIPARAAAPRR